jgi:hypothetical protein
VSSTEYTLVVTPTAFTDAMTLTTSTTSVVTAAGTQATAPAVYAADRAGTVILSSNYAIGQPMTATLADRDGGVSNATYQWKADGANIAGATLSSYTPVSQDAGKVLSLEVNYTDNHGPGKTITAVAEARRVGGNIALANGQGNLLNGQQIEGNWYYYWDRNGDGVANDTITMNALETLMYGSSTGNIITESNRTWTVGAVTMMLPTRGSSVASIAQGSGTSWSSATSGANTGTTPNATYNDYFAVWDYFNGTGTATGQAATLPAAWGSQLDFWTASQSIADQHYFVNPRVGYNEYRSDSIEFAVLFQVDSAPLVTGVVPTVAIAESAFNSTTGARTLTYTFSDAVFGFDTTDVSVSGGTKGTFTAVSSTEYTLVVTPTASTDAMSVTTSTTEVTNTAGTQATAPAVYAADRAGTVTFSNNVAIGQSVTANLTDLDGGVSNTTYQWKANGINIDGATLNSYTPGAQDAGKFISVEANYADSRGSGKTITAVAEGGKTVGGNIELANGQGNLLSGVQVEGNWYYYWDRNNDGVANDKITMDALETLMYGSSTGNVITESNRTWTVGDVTMMLPTRGSSVTSAQFGSGTSWSSATLGANTGATPNATYNDYFAVWDYFNGTGTASAQGATLPTAWGSQNDFLSASTAATADSHYTVNPRIGYNEYRSDSIEFAVLFQVISPGPLG